MHSRIRNIKSINVVKEFTMTTLQDDVDFNFIRRTDDLLLFDDDDDDDDNKSGVLVGDDEEEGNDENVAAAATIVFSISFFYFDFLFCVVVCLKSVVFLSRITFCAIGIIVRME